MGRWGRRLALAAALATLAACSGGAKGGGAVHIYNWSDYIDPALLKQFTAETGIRTTYDTFDSNEVLETKVLQGGTGYDVVVPSNHNIPRYIAAGAIRPLDKSKLPNLKNLDPRLMALAAMADPGNAYGVPYLWSVTGIGYNVAMLDRALGPTAPRDSLALLFDPAIAKKLAPCGIELLDTPQEAIPAALAYLGIDPRSRSLADLHRAIALLDKIRPYVRKFHSSQYINDLAAGDICIVLGYSGDVIQARDRAREAGSPAQIAFRVPREGAQMSIDMLAIPKDAPHPDNAHRFIDYMLRPEVIAAVTDSVSYPNPNLAATPLVKPEIRDDPGIYPPASVRRLFYLDLPAPHAYERARMRAWNRMKSGC